MSRRDDPDQGQTDLTEVEGQRIENSKQEQLTVQLGCAAILLVLAVIWLGVAHLFEWGMGWRDSWW